jgi:hypothetical protein
MSQRVTPEQAAVFAAYDEQEVGTVWYNADPKLLEQVQSTDSRADEFIWLRDLALDHAELTDALKVACEAIRDNDTFVDNDGDERNAKWAASALASIERILGGEK